VTSSWFFSYPIIFLIAWKTSNASYGDPSVG